MTLIRIMSLLMLISKENNIHIVPVLLHQEDKQGALRALDQVMELYLHF